MSSLEYAIQIWGVRSTALEKVQKVVDNALKRWHSPRQIPILEIYEKFKLLKLHEFSDYYLSTFAHNFMSKYKDTLVPHALHNFLTPYTSRGTRSDNLNFAIGSENSTLYENSVKFRIIKFWNSLPNKTKSIENVELFQIAVNQDIINKRI
jgi:hypothetical protein